MDIMSISEQSGNTDWKRIRIILAIGIAAAAVALAGDMLLGWGSASSSSLAGLEPMFIKYRGISTGRIVLSAILGLIGIPAEGLCCIAVSRLIAAGDAKLAKIYRAGIVGFAATGGAVHLSYCSAVYLYKLMYELEEETGFWEGMKYGVFFTLPVFILFLVFFGLMFAIQFHAFIRELTPYPKWCTIFSFGTGFVFLTLLKLGGGAPLFEALSDGWISLGFIFMFAGLLIMSRKAETGDFGR